MPIREPIASSVPDEGRFPPGFILADRYRIIGLLGKGGMGEVYKATDLLLSQVVALKLLPESLVGNKARAGRLLAEVRLARQISHANVCRVYDIGEAQGQLFLSMEYVDGENLESLLRRIDRLPHGKALEIARQLCAGVAAAHDKGVIHRDLKPANIMLDGHGHVRVMDFGLAGVAGTMQDIHSGTPAYMAPEQRNGLDVTARSDIYALGLVLHELITGKRAHAADDAEIDPAVERVVQWCLEEAPQQRPASARLVAAALSGGDLLAAALAAGETPSPAVLAAAGEIKGMSPRIAVACLAFILTVLVAWPFLDDRGKLLNLLPPGKEPAVLASESHDLIRSLGYMTESRDSVRGSYWDRPALEWVERSKAGSRIWQASHSDDPPPVLMYWYLETSDVFTPSFPLDVTRTPPLLSERFASGTTFVETDQLGRLIEFLGMAPQVEEPPVRQQRVDWSPLFAAARLDPSRLHETAPGWIPNRVFDTQAAWTGRDGFGDFHVEVAAWRGRPIAFQVMRPYTPTHNQDRSRFPTGQVAVIRTLELAVLALIVISALVARRNLSVGRGDRHGATRLAVFVFALSTAAGILGTGLGRTLHAGADLWMPILGTAVFKSALIGTFYLAVEPYVRRRWPQSLLSWTRLLSGRIHDAAVGRDLLLGITVALACSLVLSAEPEIRRALNLAPRVPLEIGLPGYALGSFVSLGLSLVGDAAAEAPAALLFLFLLRLVFRRDWLAGVAYVTVGTTLFFALLREPVGAIPVFVVAVTLYFLLLRFYGLLAFATSVCLANLIGIVPITADATRWYAPYGYAWLILIAALAIWSFRAAIGRRSMLSPDFAGAES